VVIVVVRMTRVNIFIGTVFGHISSIHDDLVPPIPISVSILVDGGIVHEYAEEESVSDDDDDDQDDDVAANDNAASPMAGGGGAGEDFHPSVNVAAFQYSLLGVYSLRVIFHYEFVLTASYVLMPSEWSRNEL
jgi:hypothetical protein